MSGNSHQADRSLHFGLRDATVADSVVVHWPSGIVQALTGVAADAFLHMVEPSATDVPGPVPAAPVRLGAAPNPFRHSTVLRWDTHGAPPEWAAVHDVAGRRVRSFPPPVEARGQVIWDGRDDAGRPVTAGAYFFRVGAHGEESSRKVVRLR
jgi:hypothetical protein